MCDSNSTIRNKYTLRESNPASIHYLLILADEYLSHIARKVTAATYQSHKQTITEFMANVEPERSELSRLEQPGINFLEKVVGEELYSFQTACGYVCILSNFLAYLYRDDPKLISLQLLAGLHNECCSGSREILQQSAGQLLSETGPSGPTTYTVEGVIAYLRKSRFGTRLHAYVETVVDTKARPEAIRRLDITNIDLTEKVATVGISDTHLVGDIGLVETREATLTESSVEALRWYLQKERNCDPARDSGPVFVTSRGRVSSSTIRRSLKRISESVPPGLENSGGTTAQENARAAQSPEQKVLPSDIWWYTAREIIQ
jgi:integrase